MLEPVGECSQCDSLSLRLGLPRCCAVRKSTGNIHHFCDPTSVFFLLDFNCKNHKNLCGILHVCLPTWA